MAERVEDVLSELMAAQANAPVPAPEAQTSPAEGGETTPDGNPAEGAEAGETDPTVPAPAEPVADEGGEAPPAPAADPQTEALARTAEEIEALRGQNAQLSQALGEMQQMLRQLQAQALEANRANEQAVEEAVLEPPVLPDLGSVQYQDDVDRVRALNAYGTAMADYTRKSVMRELQPIVDQYQRQTREAEDAAVKNQLLSSGRFDGMSEDMAQIDKIAATTPGLAELPPETRYTLAYIINRGVKAMNAKPAEAETAEQLVAKVMQNPDALKAIEKERVAKVATANKSAPPIAASQGQSNAPAVAPNPPQDFNEARARARKIFGLS